MDFGASIGTTKTAFDLIKALRESLGRPDVNPGEIQARLIEMQSLILDLQHALSDAEEEQRHLKKKLEDAESFKALEALMIFEESVRWMKLPDGKLRGPFCPDCWTEYNRQARLIPEDVDEVSSGRLAYGCRLHSAGIRWFYVSGQFLFHREPKWQPPNT
ncbi:MAG TPA: hypothetical protein VGL53_06330 [Bryobacteraceae bacterium]|jgi:hypothetical protein